MTTNSYLQDLHNQRKTHIEPHNPEWFRLFQSERQILQTIFGDAIIRIEHIGSTAVPGMKAKPIIDILITTSNIDGIDTFNVQMDNIGYIAGGEFGLPGRRFFCKGDKMHCQFHVHVYEDRHTAVEHYLLFRDYMIHHPQEAKNYEDLKTALAFQHPHNRTLYTEGKGKFINDIYTKAEQWKRQNHTL